MVGSIDDALHEIDDSLCAACFDVLEQALNRKQCPKRELLESLSANSLSCPLFVTWTKRMPNGEEDLRGCIGTLSPVPISRLEHYAKLSAFGDRRFSPINADEIPLLVCGVSLLHTYENAKDPYDWVVGTHGIQLEFEYQGLEYSATYLPEVAEENMWTKDVAIKHLIRKTGYRGSLNDKLLDSVKVTRYQSKKLRLTYDNYKKL
ncbi:hypothetical protein BgAZ_302570 [Babesia gibsoni]|uniref:AMMECR1 domain-containing protein n=1 Tax=Babesia gibsoni TaxID=33632 RepID=A0AAD8LIC0_BABGI|nr:hypothetical protein BgAZ_302570 [Babesia gibsoni]